MDTALAEVKAGKTGASTALHLYDQLAPIEVEFLFGRWRGYEVATDHPMDGLLALSGWYGKWFIDPETVHPLLFYQRNPHAVYSVNPGLIPVGLIRMPLLKTKLLRSLMLLAKPVVQTRKATARLRMVQYRNKVSATLVYDSQPILDSFRKIDENTVLGAMDLKGMPQPYFFRLERDPTVVNLGP